MNWCTTHSHQEAALPGNGLRQPRQQCVPQPGTRPRAWSWPGWSRPAIIALLVAAVCIGTPEESLAQPAGPGASSDHASGSSSPPTSKEPNPEEDQQLPWWLPVSFSGQAQVFAEAYHASGIESRRPGAAWRMSLTPQATLPGDLRVGMDMLLSSEGAAVRQNINQLGISPRWGWGTVHIGDFSQDLSPYTVQGTRLRGAGVELQPGSFRFALQAGRAQRTVRAGATDPATRRNLMGMRLGYGRPTDSYLDLHLVKVKDDTTAIETALAAFDTLLVDTIPEYLRPERTARPKENLTGGVTGQISLLERALVVRGEAAAAITTRDMSSPRVDPASVDAPAARLLDRLQPLRMSTGGDVAYNVDARMRLRRSTINAGYEYVGAGFNSLGLAYMMNDRRAYNLGGNTRMLDGRLTLQGRFRRQENNLLDQKLATLQRTSITTSASARITDALTTSVTATLNHVGNDAAGDTLLIDTRADAVTLNTSFRHQLLGRASTLSLAYTLQQTSDQNPVVPAPDVVAHSIATSLNVELSSRISVAPTISSVATRMNGLERQRNIYAGFRGNGRFLDGDLRTTANLTRNFNHGREVTSAMAQAAYPLPYGAALTLRARHQNHSAYGTRPAFRESFLTMSISRGF